MTDESSTPESGDESVEVSTPATFTQAEVDKIIADRLKRERESTKTKYADYDELKAAAEGKRSADERIAALEAALERSELEQLRRRVQASHGLTDADAELFLTGSDVDALTAQAERLVARDSELLKAGNRAPANQLEAPKPVDDRQAFADFLVS